MSNFVSKAPWFINSASQGNRQLRGLQDAGVEDGSSVETINEVGNEYPVGFVDKPGPITLNFTEKVMEGEPDCDWVELQKLKELFSMTRKYTAGQRVQFLDCRVSTVNESGDAEGENTREVSVMCLRRKAL